MFVWGQTTEVLDKTMWSFYRLDIQSMPKIINNGDEEKSNEKVSTKWRNTITMIGIMLVLKDKP